VLLLLLLRSPTFLLLRHLSLSRPRASAGGGTGRVGGNDDDDDEVMRRRLLPHHPGVVKPQPHCCRHTVTRLGWENPPTYRAVDSFAAMDVCDSHMGAVAVGTLVAGTYRDGKRVCLQSFLVDAAAEDAEDAEDATTA